MMGLEEGWSELMMVTGHAVGISWGKHRAHHLARTPFSSSTVGPGEATGRA